MVELVGRDFYAERPGTEMFFERGAQEGRYLQRCGKGKEVSRKRGRPDGVERGRRLKKEDAPMHSGAGCVRSGLFNVFAGYLNNYSSPSAP